MYVYQCICIPRPFLPQEKETSGEVDVTKDASRVYSSSHSFSLDLFYRNNFSQRSTISSPRPSISPSLLDPSHLLVHQVRRQTSKSPLTCPAHVSRRQNGALQTHGDARRIRQSDRCCCCYHGGAVGIHIQITLHRGTGWPRSSEAKEEMWRKLEESAPHTVTLGPVVGTSQTARGSVRCSVTRAGEGAGTVLVPLSARVETRGECERSGGRGGGWGGGRRRAEWDRV